MNRGMGWTLTVALAFFFGCQSSTVAKTTRPVLEPIKKTTETVFKERTVTLKDDTEAVLFPRDQDEEQETKHFKVKF